MLQILTKNDETERLTAEPDVLEFLSSKRLRETYFQFSVTKYICIVHFIF